MFNAGSTLDAGEEVHGCERAHLRLLDLRGPCQCNNIVSFKLVFDPLRVLDGAIKYGDFVGLEKEYRIVLLQVGSMSFWMEGELVSSGISSVPMWPEAAVTRTLDILSRILCSLAVNSK